MSDRSQKLASARKRLREFQRANPAPSSVSATDHRSRGSRSDLHSSQSSLTTTKSANLDYGTDFDNTKDKPPEEPLGININGRQSTVSLPSGIVAFHHDEQMSPFERVRGRSVGRSSPSPIPNTYNPSTNDTQFYSPIRHEQPSAFGNQPSPPAPAAPLNSTELSSISPQQQDNTYSPNHAVSLANYFSAADVSNAADNNNANVVRAASGQGETTASTQSWSDANIQQQKAMDVLNSNTILPTTVNNNQTPQHHYLAESPSDSIMASSVTNAGSYEPMAETSPTQEQYCPEHAQMQMQQRAMNTESAETVTATTESAEFVNAITQENAQMKQTLDDQHAQISQLTSQLQQLHSHYARLHEAYTQQQQASTSSNDQNAVQQQQTIAVLVEEKSELQSQLRQAMEMANSKHVENEELHGRLTANRDRLAELERKVEQSSSGRTELETQMSKQKVELDKRRQESATWEAKVVGLQQDKSELQARLKVKAREVDRLQAEIGDFRKEIQMKEIYIRQLSAHAAGVSKATEQEDQIMKMENDLSTLKTDLVTANANAEHWKWEAQQARDQYEQYGKQLNQKIVDLSAQVERLSEDRLALESTCQALRDEQQLTQTHNVSPPDSEREHSSSTTPTTTDVDVAAQRVQISEMQTQLAQLNDTVLQMQQHALAQKEDIDEKTKEIERLTALVTDREKKVAHLDEQLSIRIQYSADTEKLVEQIQNERATVSRAVAQNRELKDQLVELQDQFVKMTNENMELTTKLQATEFELKQLAETDVTEEEKHSNELTELRDKLAETRETMEQNSREYEVQHNELRQQLQAAQDELETMRVDEMHAARQHQAHEHTPSSPSARILSLEQQLTELTQTNMELQARMCETSDITHERDALKQQNMSLRADLDHLNTILAASTAATNNDERNNAQSRASAADVAELQTQVSQLQQQVHELRRGNTRIANENAELHRIMQQNAEDENQNTIHVELQQALDRITDLSNENTMLRAQMDELTNPDDRANSPTLHLHQQSHNGPGSITVCRQHDVNDSTSGRTSVCSEHREQKRDLVSSDTVDHMRTAMDQLQQRFTKAMRENADLAEQNQNLEHLITQLQYETDTVGEYVTIYQHQRRVIRERLKEKEQSLAKLSREKELIQQNLRELQSLVMRLLKARGDLHAYDSITAQHNYDSTAIPTKTRTYSQTAVDEVSGGEDVIVSYEELPAQVHMNGYQAPGHDHRLSNARQLDSSVNGDNSMDQNADLSGTTEQILRLLSEMRAPDSTDTLPIIDQRIHCKECRGKLIVL